MLYHILLYIEGRRRLSFLPLRVSDVGFAWLALGHCCPLVTHTTLGLLQPRLIPGNHAIKGRNLPLPLVVAPCR